MILRPQEFEQAVLELAMTTRVPLTRANIVFYSGVKTSLADKWLDEMIVDGLLDFDTDDDGELLYSVVGSKRPTSGAKELTRCTACKRASTAVRAVVAADSFLIRTCGRSKRKSKAKLVNTALRKLPPSVLLSSNGMEGDKNVALGGRWAARTHRLVLCCTAQSRGRVGGFPAAFFAEQVAGDWSFVADSAAVGARRCDVCVEIQPHRPAQRHFHRRQRARNARSSAPRSQARRISQQRRNC